MKEEYKKFWKFLIDSNECYFRDDKYMESGIETFLDSLPKSEASRVSENEQPKEVCEHKHMKRIGENLFQCELCNHTEEF
jgi:hypothetical protein